MHLKDLVKEEIRAAMLYDHLCMGLILLELVCLESPINDSLNKYFADGEVTYQKLREFFSEDEWWRYSNDLLLAILDCLFIFERAALSNLKEFFHYRKI